MQVWKFAETVLKRLRRLAWITFLAAGAPILVLPPLVALDATARKLVGTAIPGTLEIGEYCIFAITFMAGPWLLRQHRHVRLETLLMATSGRLRAAIETCGYLIGATTSGLMAWQGAWLVVESFQDGTVLYGQLSVPAFAMYLFIPVGSLLYLIEFCCLALESWSRPTPTQPSSSQLDNEKGMGTAV